MRGWRRCATCCVGRRPVAETLSSSGPDAAAAAFHRLVAAEPTEWDLDDDGFVDAVWGAIELHRTSLVWPLLRVWTDVRPDSSAAWTVNGWANQVDGISTWRGVSSDAPSTSRPLDPDNHEAALVMSNLPWA